MTLERRVRRGAGPLWFGAMLAVLCGYGLIFRVAAARVDERVGENRLSAARLQAVEAAVAGRPGLEAERSRLRATLSSVDAGDVTAVVSSFVRGAAHEAALRHTAVTAIAAAERTAPHVATASGPVTAPVVPADPIELVALDVTLDGRYADVLATIRRLSRLRVPASVDVTSLARKNADSRDTTLSAALRISLAHVAPAIDAAPPTE